MAAPFKRILTLDFETRWDSKEYTLSKMTTEAYIRDPRFKAFGASIHWYGDPIAKPVWITGKDLPDALGHIDWSETALLCHNTQFDGAILAWHYGILPAFYFDTLSMARALRGVEVGNSAKKLAEDFGLPPKGQAVHSTDGMVELRPAVETELAEYCNHDVWLCEEFFKRLVVNYPAQELELIDLTTRMFTQPRLLLDQEVLLPAIKEEKEKREALLAKLKVTEEDLSSNDTFADILRRVGVEPPTKKKKPTQKNPYPEGTMYAFAKTDTAFQALRNSDNETVAMLCDARMRVKSTLERTRAQRFYDISTRGPLPAPLSYYGAHTGRFQAAKGSSINLQNLKRGSFLRKAIYAPPGFKLVVADLSQIEPRVLAWLAADAELLDMFRSGADPYAAFGARMFNIPGMTKESHPALRQSAKSALLGCGYGLGWFSFAGQLMAGFLGAPPVTYDRQFLLQVDPHGYSFQFRLQDPEFLRRVSEVPHVCSFDDLLVHCLATAVLIDKYRNANKRVQALWNTFSIGIQQMYDGSGVLNDGYMGLRAHEVLTVEHERLRLPNGMYLRYPRLRAEYDRNVETGNLRKQWLYGDGTKLYGGRLTENVVQALARIVMTDGMLRIKKRYPIVLTVHDEVVVMVPENEAEEAKEWCRQQMVVEPSYMRGLPLAASADVATRYGDAK